MNIASAVVVFVIIWWSVFFVVLPFGVRSRWEDADINDDKVKGADPGAPSNLNMKRKLFQTTVISTVIWVPVIAFIASGLINFRE
ncbi:MAG: DUF1467 family protein [Pseudomonadota bacterium]